MPNNSSKPSGFEYYISPPRDFFTMMSHVGAGILVTLRTTKNQKVLEDFLFRLQYSKMHYSWKSEQLLL